MRAAMLAVMLAMTAGPVLAQTFDDNVLCEFNGAWTDPAPMAHELEDEPAGDRVAIRHSDPVAVREAVDFVRRPAPLAMTAGPALAQTFDDEVLREVNRVRANPAAMADELERDRIANRRSDPGAVQEAIAFLRRQAPLPPLRDDGRLDSAALEHVSLQGPTGGVGHGAPGDLGRRLRGHNLWAGVAAETISYGQPNPRDVVRQLVIDFDVPDRGHREVLFSDGYSLAGVACGAHAAWGSMCVIDLAGALPPRY